MVAQRQLANDSSVAVDDDDVVTVDFHGRVQTVECHGGAAVSAAPAGNSTGGQQHRRGIRSGLAAWARSMAPRAPTSEY